MAPLLPGQPVPCREGRTSCLHRRRRSLSQHLHVAGHLVPAEDVTASRAAITSSHQKGPPGCRHTQSGTTLWGSWGCRRRSFPQRLGACRCSRGALPVPEQVGQAGSAAAARANSSLRKKSRTSIILELIERLPAVKQLRGTMSPHDENLTIALEDAAPRPKQRGLPAKDLR